MNTFGPQTRAIETLLARASTLTQRELYELQEAYRLTRGAGDLEHLTMGRDYSWHRLHEGLQGQPGLTDAFNRLWEHLRPTWSTFQAGYAIQDGACAMLLRGHLTDGPYRLADYDLLLAPWRSVVEHDARSRLALTIAHQHPHEVDEHWWAVIDAVLAPQA